MDWRQALIEEHRQTIQLLRQTHEDMRSGTFRMMSYEDGEWININDRIIERDEKTIATLERIIEAAEKAQ